jgi:hypothetical protein
LWHQVTYFLDFVIRLDSARYFLSIGLVSDLHVPVKNPKNLMSDVTILLTLTGQTAINKLEVSRFTFFDTSAVA